MTDQPKVGVTHVAPRGESGDPLRIVLDGREGNRLFVRRLNPGEPEPSEPIWWNPSTEELVPFTPLAGVGIHTTPDVGRSDDMIVYLPIAEVRREEGILFVRTLELGEPPPAEPIRLFPGESVTIEPGALAVSLDVIDATVEPQADGYAPIANTIWTWFGIGGPPPEAGARYLLAAARRLDAAHSNLVLTRSGLTALADIDFGPALRTKVFEVIGAVETSIVSLGRAVDMANRLKEKIELSTLVPATVVEVAPKMKELRNAYEHIDERAIGLVKGKPDSEALTIFDWSPLFESGVVKYKDHSLDLNDEVSAVFRDLRAFLKQAASELKQPDQGVVSDT